MTTKVQAPGAQAARQGAVEKQPFHGLILDLGMADKTQVELFGAVGRTRGPFQGVIDWPYLNGVVEEQSQTLLASEGEDAWRAAGGRYGDDGKPTFHWRSCRAAQIVQGIAQETGGFIWTDAHGTGWAVSLVPLAAPQTYAGLAISWSGAGRVIDPVAREEYRRAVEQQLAELIPGGEAATRHHLQQLADRIWLYERAEQVLWAIHAAVLLQRTSVISLPDLALGEIIWGGDWRSWPSNWRNTLMDILSSLSELHVAALHIGGMEWRPRLTMRSVAVAYYQLLERGRKHGNGCNSLCPFWNRPVPHDHFLIQIGYGFLGLLEHFAVSDNKEGERQFDFEQKKLPGDAGKAIAEARKSGRLVPVHLLTKVFSRLTRGQTGIIQALVREVTRARGKGNSARPDKAEVLVGNQVPDVRGRQRIVCPLLRRDGRYVGFNGNGLRRGLGYLLVGKGSSGWLARCGSVMTVGTEPKWSGKSGVGRDVRTFLKELDEVARMIGLTVLGLARRTGAWLNLEQVVGLAALSIGLGRLNDIHLRIYGPEDYLDRVRSLVAARGQFASIPGAPSGQGMAPGSLLGDPNLELKMRMHQKGLSQDDLARQLGVSKSFVSKLLSGTKMWPEGMWERAEAVVRDV
jgi:hypothetical protein